MLDVVFFLIFFFEARAALANSLSGHFEKAAASLTTGAGGEAAPSKLSAESSSSGTSGATITTSTTTTPLGVCAILTPWTTPLESLCSKLAPCLAAGNVVVAKPDECAPQSITLF